MPRAKRRASKGTDPWLQTYEWRVKTRSHFLARQDPCGVCGGAIDYQGGRYLPGTRRVNPASLVVGHVVGRDQAKRMGWTIERANDLSNLRAEHARCSDRSGARYVNAKRGLRRQGTTRPNSSNPLVTSRQW